ncbi:MAG: asparagine synthase-related protein [Bacteroidales bacterium]
MVKLLLDNTKWTELNSIWFSGYIIINDNYIGGNEAINQIDIPANFSDFANLVNTLNGRFSVIMKKGNETWVVSDKLRSIPLFFTKKERTTLISDNVENLFNKNIPPYPERKAVDVFLRTGYTINNYSLIKDIFITEPAEIITFKKDGWEKFYYLTHLNPNILAKVDAKKKERQLEEILHQIFSRLFNALGSRPVVIPLSGGYDSRLITYMAKKYHKGSIQTYTYGVKNNCEVANAKRTAEILGLDWLFIEYNKELIEDFTSSKTFKSYYRYASNYSSLFWLQDYFAVKELKHEGMIPENSIFIPGLSGDAIAGVSLSKKKVPLNDTANHIFIDNFNLINSSRSQKASIAQEINESCNTVETYGWEAPYKWNIFHRQAKFVANSARVYSFFGYNYYLPFWDNEFLFFFLSLPYELKAFKKLYNDVVEQIFKDDNLLFEKELQPSIYYRKFQSFKDNVKTLLPSLLVNALTSNKSPFYYEEITKLLRNELDKEKMIPPKQPNYYNAYIAQWYLQRIFNNHTS